MNDECSMYQYLHLLYAQVLQRIWVPSEGHYTTSPEFLKRHSPPRPPSKRAGGGLVLPDGWASILDVVPIISQHWAALHITLAGCSLTDTTGLLIESSDWLNEPSSPRKQETLTRCCFNIGPPSATLAQHWVNVSCLLGFSESEFPQRNMNKRALTLPCSQFPDRRTMHFKQVGRL